MLIPADPLDAAALEAALQPGQRRYPRQRLEVDWDRDGTWDHAYTDLTDIQPVVVHKQELTDSTPGSTVVASGAVAAQLTVTFEGSALVSGVRMPVAELFAPYNPSSPLYGLTVEDTPIRWTVEFSTSRGWIGDVLFTGWLDECQVVRGDNRVVFTAVNIPPELRAPTFWPLWAVEGPAAARVRDSGPQRGLASSVADYICNAAGLRTRPRPPWESTTGVIALTWLPLCGSFAPAAGKMISQHPWGSAGLFPEVYPISPAIDPQGEYWIEGPFGTARNAEAHRYPGALIYTTRDDQPTWDGRSTSVSAWIYCGPTAPGYDENASSSLRPPVAQVHFGYGITTNYYAYRLSIATDGVTVQVQVENGTSTLRYGTYTPGSNAYRHVHAQLDHNTGSVVRCKLIVDGTTQVDFTGSTGSTIAAPILNNLFLPQVGFHLRPGVRMADAMAWQETGAPAVTPERTVHGGVRAEIDMSLNQITHLPPPGDGGWDTIKAIAAAEYAAVDIDQDGVLRYRVRTNLRGTDQQTITLSSAAEVGTTTSSDGRANAVVISVQPGEASWQLAWQPASIDQIVGPPGVTEWVFPTDDTVIAVESGTVPALYQSADSASSLPVWSGSVNSGYVFVFDGTETEELLDQNMVNTTDQAGLDDKQLIRIVVTNSTTSGGRFRLKDDNTAGTDPQPALRIAGLVLARQPAEQETVTSDANIEADGNTRTIRLAGGEWRQHLESVRDAAYFVLRRTTQPIPAFGRFDTPGDPRRQLTDSYILELGATGPRVVAYAGGITHTFMQAGFRDQLIIRATHAPGRWALGDPVLGVLESTAILG